MDGVEEKRYLGTITGVVNTSDSYVITAQIPSVIDKITCYPDERCYDEPNIGDVVWVYDLDPLFHSYFTYKRITEDTGKGTGKGAYVGMRNRGKSLTFNDNYIQAGIYDNGDFDSDNDTPQCTSFYNLDSDGNMVTKLESDSIEDIERNKIINIDGDLVLRVGGSVSIEFEGDAKLLSHGTISLAAVTLNLEAEQINVGGGGGKGANSTLNINSVFPAVFSTCSNCLANTAIPHGSNNINLKGGEFSDDVINPSNISDASDITQAYGITTSDAETDTTITEGIDVPLVLDPEALQMYTDTANGTI